MKLFQKREYQLDDGRRATVEKLSQGVVFYSTPDRRSQSMPIRVFKRKVVE